MGEIKNELIEDFKCMYLTIGVNILYDRSTSTGNSFCKNNFYFPKNYFTKFILHKKNLSINTTLHAKALHE